MTERIITIATRVFTDVPMLAFIMTDPVFGWVKCMLYITPLYVFFCAVVIFVSDYFHANGIDITGIEEMRTIRSSQELKKRQFIKRFIKWFMHREVLIFWIGSWFYLDPDYVTLMIRKKGDSFLKTILTITVPSVLVSMFFWTTLYWLVYQPFKHTVWAQWIVERLDWL